MVVFVSYRAAVLIASDLGAAGQRADQSGPLVCALLADAGYVVTAQALHPDDPDVLSGQLLSWCQSGTIDLILTTGGTGLSPRDCMPEVTLSVAQRQVPGIAEALRLHSLSITPRAMFGRGVAVIRGNTLIINLPGSPKAVRESLSFLLPELGHGLDILTGTTGNCARS